VRISCPCISTVWVFQLINYIKNCHVWIINEHYFNFFLCPCISAICASQLSVRLSCPCVSAIRASQLSVRLHVHKSQYPCVSAVSCVINEHYFQLLHSTVRTYQLSVSCPCISTYSRLRVTILVSCPCISTYSRLVCAYQLSFMFGLLTYFNFFLNCPCVSAVRASQLILVSV
jgi:hypothetical protein